jgi:hypothetical protein
MTYQQQYPAQGQQLSQVIRRPMTMEERQLPGNFYKGLQNGLRGLSLACLIMFVLSTYILPVMISDPITYDTLSTILMVFMAVFGLVAIGMAVNTIAVRRKVSQVMAEGAAVEVFGPAYRAGAMRKGQGWTVGPISVLPTRGIDGMLVEGMPARVLCVPRLKAALSINNIGLRRGARITCPPNLESMAVPMGMLAQPTFPQGQDPSYPQYGQSMPESPPASYFEEPPPPPPPPD